MKTTSDASRYRANLQGEIDGAAVYRAMAAAEKNPQLASVYERLAEVEERHLSFWDDQLRAIGVEPGPRRPSWRARIMALLARRFGPRIVLSTVATLEQVDQGAYDAQPETADTNMRDQERSHARVLAYVAGGSPQGIAGETLAKLEGRHRAPGGNALRAAVLGANDGLTSNLALVMARSRRLKERQDPEHWQRNQAKYLAESRAILTDAAEANTKCDDRYGRSPSTIAVASASPLQVQVFVMRSSHVTRSTVISSRFVSLNTSWRAPG